MDEAIASAVEAVRAAGATVDRVEPDPLASLSEIGSRTGMTRAAITNYSKGKRSKAFPAPVAKVTSDGPLWDWAAVARWLFTQKRVAPEVALEAEVVKEANEAIKVGEPNIRERLKRRARESEAAL